MNPEQTNNSDASDNISQAEESTSPAINQPITNNEPPKKNKKWKKILIIVSFIIIAIPLLGYLLLVISFSGGISGVISDLKSEPKPESSSVVSERNTAKDSINSSFTELGSKIGLTNYATSTHDRCYEGQNNWKVKDGYAHRCTYRITKFYGLNGDFSSKMVDFEKTIYDLDWHPPQWQNNDYPLRDIMQSYERNRKDQTYLTSPNFPNGYLVSDAPTPTGGYERESSILEIQYAEKDTKELFRIDYAQNVSRDTLFETYDNKAFRNISSVFKKITKDDQFVIVISIQEDYFQN